MSMPANTNASSGSVKITPKMVMIGVLVLLAVIFVAQNTDSSSLKLFFFTIEMPTWIAFVVLLAIGAVIGYFGRGMRDKRSAGG